VKVRARHPTKSHGLLRQTERVAFAVMLAEKAHDPGRTMCAVVGGSRSGVSAWRGRPLICPQGEANRGLRRIRAIHAASRGRYGSPRVHAALQAGGQRVGRNRVMRLMRLDPRRGRPRRRFRLTTQAEPQGRAGP
jgi:hypothetical protein